MVEAVFALPAAVDAAGDGHLGIWDGQGAIGIVKRERHLAIGLRAGAAACR